MNATVAFTTTNAEPPCTPINATLNHLTEVKGVRVEESRYRHVEGFDLLDGLHRLCFVLPSGGEQSGGAVRRGLSGSLQGLTLPPVWLCVNEREGAWLTWRCMWGINGHGNNFTTA
jgi:hypothetical protein